MIWHTRPLPAARYLAQRCRDLGAEVITAPALTIRALGEGDPRWPQMQATLRQLHSYDHTIFVSGNAVQHGLACMRSAWPAWPPRTPCYAIGPTTARLLAAAGIEARQAAGPRMNSEALLELPALQALAGQRVLIVRGVGGRGWLAQVLTARGASVDYLEVYRREKSDTLPEQVSAGIVNGTIDFITASSGETVENIVELVDDDLHPRLLGVKIVVPGARVAAIARRCGFCRIIEATNAGDDAVIASMVTVTNQLLVNNNGGRGA